MSIDTKYTTDQIILYLVKSGYELVRRPRRGRYYLEHKSRKNFPILIIQMGRDDFTAEYVKILLKNSPLTFTDFKKMVT